MGRIKPEAALPWSMGVRALMMAFYGACRTRYTRSFGKDRYDRTPGAAGRLWGICWSLSPKLPLRMYLAEFGQISESAIGMGLFRILCQVGMQPARTIVVTPASHQESCISSRMSLA